MARGINKVILVGNLGADPETRYTANGGAITNIRLATSESWKDKLTGENQALQSVLYGLCMGLSQMSDLHREVVAQAFEYVQGAPRSNYPGQGEQVLAAREQAFRAALNGLKDAVTSRFRG